jgi:hypothetical protein
MNQQRYKPTLRPWGFREDEPLDLEELMFGGLREYWWDTLEKRYVVKNERGEFVAAKRPGS